MKEKEGLNLDPEKTGALQQILRSRIMKTLGAVVAPFVLISCVMGGPYSIKKYLKPPSLENRVLKVDRNGRLAVVWGYGDGSKVWVLPAGEVPPNPTEEWLANSKFSDYWYFYSEVKNASYVEGKLFRFGDEYYLLAKTSEGHHMLSKANFHPDLKMEKLLGSKTGITYDPSTQSFTAESGILRISGSGSWTFEKFPPGFKPVSRDGKTSKFKPTPKDKAIKRQASNL
ncbi:MAG: hypothetical protein ABIH35_04520 [Patescibacteria group bacterium]